MNVHEMAKAFKSSIPCGNWTLKQKSNGNTFLEFWTTTANLNENVESSISNYSSRHKREFHKAEIRVDAYFIYKENIIMVRGKSKENNDIFFNAPLLHKYRPPSSRFEQQSDKKIFALLKNNCVEITLVK